MDISKIKQKYSERLIMTGRELRNILRFNKIKNYTFVEMCGISVTTLNRIVNASTEKFPKWDMIGNLEVPRRIVLVLSEILKLDLTDNENLKLVLNQIPQCFIDKLDDDNRKYWERGPDYAYQNRY